MRSLLARLTGRRPPEPSIPAPTLRVDHPAVYIGDIHGRADLLDRLLTKLETAHPDACASATVFLGDYIDRGEQSADVVARLHELSTSLPAVTCLKGNHEDMLMEFLADPAAHGRSWLKHGGLQTLASYGVGLPSGARDGDALLPVAQALTDAIGAERLAWLNSLPTYALNGNLAAVHAGADPELPVASQSPSTLMWGHPQFDTQPRLDGTLCVHGHTIRDTAGAGPAGHIGVDTGAYATGTLSAAIVTPDTPEVQYLTA